MHSVRHTRLSLRHELFTVKGFGGESPLYLALSVCYDVKLYELGCMLVGALSIKRGTSLFRHLLLGLLPFTYGENVKEM